MADPGKALDYKTPGATYAASRASRENEMAHLTLTLYLTRGHSDVLEHQIQTTHRGQAHFGNTGPFGAVCGECAFLGYYQQRHNKSGDLITAKHRSGCKKFCELTGNHGPTVPASAAACRYFERKEEEGK
jgi:hypothetical protein